MSYYDDIKQKLLDNEIYSKLKDETQRTLVSEHTGLTNIVLPSEL